MDKTYDYLKDGKDKDFVVASMKKYVEREQEMDKFLRPLIAPFIEGQEVSVLDACCGIGHLSQLLSKLSPRSNFLGVDQTSYLIEQARELSRDNERVRFEVADVYDLPIKYGKRFDISLSWKTISWLPYYDRMLEALIAVTKRHLFLSSLFYDGDIDFEIKVREFKKEAGRDGFNSYYNVYSLPRFKEVADHLGAKKMQAYDFNIEVDIPRPPLDQMGTYTVRLEDGRRMQISGALVMSWKVIRIDL